MFRVPTRYGSPGSTPLPSICKLLAAFLRSSFAFARSLQHFWLPALRLLGTCYLLDDPRSTHTPSKYLRATYSHIHRCHVSTWFPTHRRPYGFRSFSSTKMSFSLQRNVIFSHVDVKNRVLKISKTTSFFDVSSCFFGMQHFFPSSQKRFIALTALQSSSRNRWGVNGPKDFRQQ